MAKGKAKGKKMEKENEMAKARGKEERAASVARVVGAIYGLMTGKGMEEEGREKEAMLLVQAGFLMNLSPPVE